MTNSVNGIGGNSYSYNNYGYNNNGAEEPKTNTTEQAPVVPETKDVDPNKVMEFLNQYGFVAPEVKTAGVGEVDAETKERIEKFMEQFQYIYGIVENEFGAELAPEVMDIIMDKLMGMLA